VRSSLCIRKNNANREIRKALEPGKSRYFSWCRGIRPEPPKIPHVVDRKQRPMIKRTASTAGPTHWPELLTRVHRQQPVTFLPKQARQIRGRGRRKLPDRAKPGFLRHVLRTSYLPLPCSSWTRIFLPSNLHLAS
jgi:hypothetical protein